MKVDFELEIHRTTGREIERPMSIRITDNTSGCRILEVYFGLADFMDILTGRCGLHAEGDFYSTNPIGCTREHKEELVPSPKGYKPDEVEDSAILAPFEVEGWKARREDLHNHHRSNKDKQRVTFTRFIKPDGSIF